MLLSINGPLMTLRHDHFMTKCGSVLCSGSALHGPPLLYMGQLCSTWVWRESLGRVGPLVITAGSRAASRPASSAVRTTTLSGLPPGTGAQVQYQVQALCMAYQKVMKQELIYKYQVQSVCLAYHQVQELKYKCHLPKI